MTRSQRTGTGRATGLSFSGATAALRTLAPRPEFALDESPAPSHVAPFAFALQAEGRHDSVDETTGRFVLLHDPDGHAAWEGSFRFVTFIRAAVELEMVADPAVTGVVWSWLQESLQERSAAWHAESGTVTRTTSASFGGLSTRGAVGEIEMRASWTPSDADIRAHGLAWLDLLARLAGLPPLPEGVTALPRTSRTR